jgi:hypothetical protein
MTFRKWLPHQQPRQYQDVKSGDGKEHRSEWLFLRLVTQELLSGDCARRSADKREK